MRPLAIYMFFLEKYLLRSFAHFLIELFVFLVLNHVSSSYILEINPLSDVSLVNIIPCSGLPFHFVDAFLCCVKAFQFDVFPFVYFSFVSFAQGDISAKLLL